jgi:hypothetical protein
MVEGEQGNKITEGRWPKVTRFFVTAQIVVRNMENKCRSGACRAAYCTKPCPLMEEQCPDGCPTSP